MKYVVYITLSLVILSSCSSTKHLKDGEYLLFKTNIKGNKNFSTETLEEFYRQTEVHKFPLLPFTPYVSAYYFGKRFYDTTKIENRFNGKISKIESKLSNAKDDSSKSRKFRKRLITKKEKKETVLTEGNWMMRTIGEKPVIYDSLLASVSTNQIHLYLKSKGYFNSDVHFEGKKKNKKIWLSFIIDEKEPYTIRSVNYQIQDPIIKKLINTRLKKELNLVVGSNYDEEKIETERQELSFLMKNNGYFDFKRQYISFEIDSTVGNHEVGIKTLISNPKGGEGHKVYELSDVNFTIDAGISPPRKHPVRDTVDFKNVNYMQYEKTFSKKILDRKMLLYPNEKYSLNNNLITQKNIADLEMFKFVNINYFKSDSVGDNKLTAQVVTSPFSKYNFTSELGVNVLQGLPGPFGNVSFRTRNLLRAAEVFQITLRGGIEGQASAIDPDLIYRSQEFGAVASLTYSHFILPFGVSNLFNNNNPKTRLTVGYNYIQRPEYTRENLNASLNFLWQKKKFNQFILTPIEMSVINTKDKSPIFDNYLKQLRNLGNNLYQSFQPSVISSMSFSYVFNNNQLAQKKKSRYLRLLAESGGTILSLINQDLLNEKDQIFGLDYFRYLKGVVDARFYHPITKNTMLAYRASVGAAKPIGGLKALPYEKYFFTGGSYSNRAWLPRRIGPGAYTPLNSDGTFDDTYTFEQPGEIIIEANTEIRYNIIGFIDGALFVDASNVWTFEGHSSKPNASFSEESFLNEIAVGVGTGFRFDFSFLIMRLDWGVKIWDPAFELNDRYTFKGLTVKEFFQDERLTVLNIGIGYPF